MAGKRSRRARELDREPLDREASAKKPGLAAGSSRGRIAALQRSASFFVSLRGAVQPRTAVAKADPLEPFADLVSRTKITARRSGAFS